MSAPLRLTGTVASAGFAEGPLAVLAASAGRYRPKPTPRAEAETLTGAIAAAMQGLTQMIEAADADSAAILEFQMAMLEDEALAAPALAAIAEGVPADQAWREALAAEIAGYEASGDDYFRARAADLGDIRDQVLAVLTSGGVETIAPGSILIAEDLAPTQFLRVDWSRGGGIALTRGSASSHVAMLARARDVPMLVGLGAPPPERAATALLDGEAGTIVLDPGAEEVAAFARSLSLYSRRRAGERDYLARPAVTHDGIAVRVLVNIADPSETRTLDIATCDGVGLMRTEFLFGGHDGLPDEESQFRAYRAVLEWAAGKPVTIRTVDAGGDKPVAGFTIDERNPFLGLRGIRLSLARPEILRVQARALLRAAAHGTLKVMFPMVAVPGELSAATDIFAREAASLAELGVDHAMPPLGIMVEVPAAALAPERFDGAAFFSIGSNDLTQYVMAAARDSGEVAALNDVLEPAVLRLIAEVADWGQRAGVPVSLCGDAGGDARAIPALLRAGLRELSVAPSRLAATKAAIAAVDLHAA